SASRSVTSARSSAGRPSGPTNPRSAASLSAADSGVMISYVTTNRAFMVVVSRSEWGLLPLIRELALCGPSSRLHIGRQQRVTQRRANFDNLDHRLEGVWRVVFLDDFGVVVVAVSAKPYITLHHGRRLQCASVKRSIRSIRRTISAHHRRLPATRRPSC